MIQTLLPPQMPLIHYLHDSNCHTQQKDDQGMQQIQSDVRVIRSDIVNKIEQSMQVKVNLTSFYGFFYEWKFFNILNISEESHGRIH